MQWMLFSGPSLARPRAMDIIEEEDIWRDSLEGVFRILYFKGGAVGGDVVGAADRSSSVSQLISEIFPNTTLPAFASGRNRFK